MKKWKYALLIAMMSVAITGCKGGNVDDAPKEETVKEEASQDSSKKQDDNEENIDGETPQEEEVVTQTVEGAPFVKVEHVYYESEEDPEFYTYFYGSYDVASVEGEGYEDLQQSVSEWFADYETSYRDEAKRMTEDAKAYVNPDDGNYNSSYMNNTAVTARADENVLSFAMASETYQGGAHGNIYNYGVSFDSKTGKELSFADLGEIREDVKAYIKDKLANNSEVLEGMIVDDYNAVVDETIDGEPAWYLSGSGLTITFNEYELLCYAAGDYVVTIPYENMPGFNEAYKRTDCYFAPLSSWTPMLVDVGNDGTYEEISIDCNYEDEYSGMSVDISVAGNKTTVIDYCYNADGYFLHTKEGKDYVLVCGLSDNDYVMTSLVEIKDGVPSKLTEEGMDILAMSGDKMWTKRKVDVLGSYIGSCTMEIKDGTFSRIEERFEFPTNKDNEWYWMPTIKELPCKLMKDGALEDATLPAGTKICICNTDGESVAGFELEDGTYGEISIDVTSWPHTIDGVDENEYFDMLPYAG